MLKETDIGKCVGRKERGFCRRREMLRETDTGECQVRREQTFCRRRDANWNMYRQKTGEEVVKFLENNRE